MAPALDSDALIKRLRTELANAQVQIHEATTPDSKRQAVERYYATLEAFTRTVLGDAAEPRGVDPEGGEVSRDH